MKTLARFQPAAEPIQFANGQAARTRGIHLSCGKVERNSCARWQKLRDCCNSQRANYDIVFFTRQSRFSISKRSTKQETAFSVRNVESHDGSVKEWWVTAANKKGLVHIQFDVTLEFLGTRKGCVGDWCEYFEVRTPRRFIGKKVHALQISLNAALSGCWNAIYLTPLPAQELETISHKRGWWYIKSTQKNYAVCSQEERSFQTLILSYKGVWNFGNKDKFFLCLEIVNVKAKYYFFL